MRVLEITEQQQIINVWSCMSAICEFISVRQITFATSLYPKLFVLLKNFLLVLRTHKQQVIIWKGWYVWIWYISVFYSIVNSSSSGSDSCSFSCLSSLRRWTRTDQRNVDEYNKSIGKWKRTELVLCFWDKVPSKYGHRDKGHRFNPKYGHCDT